MKERFVELENLLTKECEKYEKDCAACPYAKECEEYKNLYMELPADETVHKPGDIMSQKFRKDFCLEYRREHGNA